MHTLAHLVEFFIYDPRQSEISDFHGSVIFSDENVSGGQISVNVAFSFDITHTVCYLKTTMI